MCPSPAVFQSGDVAGTHVTRVTPRETAGAESGAAHTRVPLLGSSAASDGAIKASDSDSSSLSAALHTNAANLVSMLRRLEREGEFQKNEKNEMLMLNEESDVNAHGT